MRDPVPSVSDHGLKLSAERRRVSLAGLGAALRSQAAATAVLIAAMLWLGALFLWLPNRIYQGDFGDYYVAAVMLHQGLNPYTTSNHPLGLRLGLHTSDLYDYSPETPTFLLCYQAMIMLPVQAAYWTWFMINLVAGGIALYLLLEPVAREGGTVLMTWLLALALVFPPLRDVFIYAQSQILILLLLVLMLRWMERDGAAGLILALAALLRAYPLTIGLHLVAQRRWRALAFVCGGLAVGGAVTMALVGIERSLSWLESIRSGLNLVCRLYVNNIAPAAFFWRVIYDWVGPNPGLAGRFLLWAAEPCTMLVILALTVHATVGNSRDPGQRAFGLWAVTSIVALPVAWIHYAVLLLIPFAMMVLAACRQSLSRRVAVAALASYVLMLGSALTAGLLLHRGLRHLAWRAADGMPLSLLAGYLATYWFVKDAPQGERAVGYLSAHWFAVDER